MIKLNSIDEYRGLHDRIVADGDPEKTTVVIPAGTCGQASGANDLIRIAKRAFLEEGFRDRLSLLVTGCHGWCEMEPSVLLAPEGVFYPRVDLKGMAKIVEAAAKGEVVEDLLFEDPETGDRKRRQGDIAFFQRQERAILSKNEKIDPIRIYNYIQHDGYASLAKVLERGEPGWILEEMKASGLRGRGGGGFPTGLKWELLSNQSNGTGKFLICNADEGDPGAYMDRSVLEGNPHSVIEGMAIGALATGATKGVLYVRNEYPLAIKHLVIALRQARELGFLGDGILGTGLCFDIQIVRGAGAFVCGEETALIRSIEGKMGEPRQRPPFPVQKGIDGKPTLVNNVETWANVPVIFEKGSDAFASVGTKNNAGTKIFSLVGKVMNTGLVEVPMGITIREIAYDIGGGPSGKSKIKAVQTGGPSGGCIPADQFDLPIDYDSLARAGSIMGSGGMIVMDENTCMVDVAKYFMAFLKDESCGKCFTCRKGTQRMHEILDDISNGEGSREHVSLLEELAVAVKETTMCGLGRTASNPVLSTLKYFRQEYVEHIENKRCPAGVCKALITFTITEACNGCTLCVKSCPETAIEGKKKERHEIDQDKCIRCGACRSVCKHDAVSVT
ncbi:MAG: NADH-ubiquinone oxidoreductase-F iron-sulfur binding region domain-containing protein [Planctomycetota bacterium]|jgi:NADH-quinone oxidoreductase subunit F